MKPAREVRHSLPRIETHAGSQPVPGAVRVAANDELARQAERDAEPMGPLWVITISMGAFFLIAALIIALD
jgi:hypothetical protein